MRVLLIDDDDVLRDALAETLELADIDVTAVGSAAEAIKIVDAHFEGIILSDIRMPNIDGLQLFEIVRAVDPELPVMLMTGHGDVATAVTALKNGAFDFLTKPFDIDQALISIRRALAVRKLVLDNRKLREAAIDAAAGEPLIGETAIMRRLRATIRQVAQTDVDVLIEGETGTGKELVASLLHAWSKRRGRRFVAVNCAGLSAAQAETELFGRSETNAPRERAIIGQIEASNSGTLFLDEIESLSLEGQGRLLRVVEEREVPSGNADRPKSLDLRIVTATKVDLEQAAAARNFRSDLLYRLNAVRLYLPPLRERREDIPLLFGHFMAEAAQRYQRPIPDIGAALHAKILHYDWPGNVREVRNVANRTVLGIGDTGPEQQASALSMPERLRQIEAALIREALEKNGGDVNVVTQLLGVPRKTFYHKARAYGISVRDYRKQ